MPSFGGGDRNEISNTVTKHVFRKCHSHTTFADTDYGTTITSTFYAGVARVERSNHGRRSRAAAVSTNSLVLATPLAFILLGRSVPGRVIDDAEMLGWISRAAAAAAAVGGTAGAQ